MWPFKVESTIQEIWKSNKGEAKTKIIGFGPGMSVEGILEQLSMAMKRLPWETNYCPKLTVFDSKKVRKSLHLQVTETIKFEQQRTMAPSCSPTKRQ